MEVDSISGQFLSIQAEGLTDMTVPLLLVLNTASAEVGAIFLA